MSDPEPQPFTITDHHGRRVSGAKPVMEMTRAEYAAARSHALREAVLAPMRQQEAAELAQATARHAAKREGE